MAAQKLCPKITCSEDDRLPADELRRLRHAPRIDEFRTTKHAPLRVVIAELSEVVIASYAPQFRRRYASRARMQVELLILSLYLAWGRRAPAVRYSLHRDDYDSQECRRHYKLTYSVLVERALPCLVHAGYIRARCGYVEPERQLTFEKIGWHPFAVEFSADFPEVRLRRRKARIKDRSGRRRYERNADGTFRRVAPVMLPDKVPKLQAKIAEYAAEVKAINAVVEPTFIYPLVPNKGLRKWKRRIDVTRRRYYRVFNNVTPSAKRLDQGGRLYGHYVQRLSEEQRRHLWIGGEDGEPVVEIDFSSMEVALAYAEAKKPLPLEEGYDAYLPLDVPREERKPYKTLMLIMLNNDSREKALRAALRKKRDPDRDLSHLGEDEIRRRMKQLEERHSPHIKIYGKKAGMKRMNRESNIAVGIVRKLAARNVPSWSVHDSFLVPASRAKEAEEIICSEFHAQTGFTIKVKIQESCIPAGLTPATADRQEYSEFFRQRDAHEQKYGPIS